MPIVVIESIDQTSKVIPEREEKQITSIEDNKSIEQAKSYSYHSN